jgi:hypothetical protein
MKSITKEAALKSAESWHTPAGIVAREALRAEITRERLVRSHLLPDQFRGEAGALVARLRRLPKGLALSGRKAMNLFRRWGIAS